MGAEMAHECFLKEVHFSDTTLPKCIKSIQILQKKCFISFYSSQLLQNTSRNAFQSVIHSKIHYAVIFGKNADFKIAELQLFEKVL